MYEFKKGQILQVIDKTTMFVVNYIQFMPVPFGARSKAWVFGFSVARVVLPSVVP